MAVVYITDTCSGAEVKHVCVGAEEYVSAAYTIAIIILFRNYLSLFVAVRVLQKL